MMRFNSLPFAVLLHCSVALLSAGSASATSLKQCPCELLEQPDLWQKELTARWMVHSIDWGVLSTLSTRLPVRTPFGNVYSFVDGSCSNATGIPYFYGTYKDQSFKDMRQNPQASFTLSEASLNSVCSARIASSNGKVSSNALKGCAIAPSQFGDPENPLCARLTLTGELKHVDTETDAAEFQMAKAALFQRHESMKSWPDDHDWVIAKLEIKDIWLIDYFGGASIVDVDKYFAADIMSDANFDEDTTEDNTRLLRYVKF